MLTKFKSYSILVLLLIVIGLVSVWKSDRASYESKIKLLSDAVQTKAALVLELNSNLNQLQLEADRLRKERQFVSELNLKYKADLDRIEMQFESELESIRKLRQSENETVRVWVDTDLPADVARMLKYTRATGNNSNGN
ncbi:hypothetical protein [Alishewanella sp. WH16-1]|uniref:hypothetical protein n=1 Tax=Alishewanella sp. WH16-1 TaxID=1651088 RepID=UPI00070D22AC|nr:hypothetical protein [Alishewanella sp. WH16-1]